MADAKILGETQMNYMKHIVIADDERLQCEMLNQILKQKDPEIIVYMAANGQEAYEYLQKNQADVLVTDIQMPVMDGIELIRRVSEEWPEIKIVLISAYQEFEYAHKALEYRAVDYLLKPFRVEKFLDIIGKIDDELEGTHRDSAQMNYYEKIVQLYHKDCRMQKLAQLLRGKTSVQRIEEEQYQSLCDEGVIVLLRWKRLSQNKQEGITELQQEKLLQEIDQSFSNGYLVPLDKGVDAQEYRMALVVQGSTAEDAEDQIKLCQEKLRQRKIIFWSGISRAYKPLAEHISRAVEDAEEMVAFSFFTKNVGGVFGWSEYGESVNRIPKSVSGMEKKMQEQIHKGNIEATLE